MGAISGPLTAVLWFDAGLCLLFLVTGHRLIPAPLREAAKSNAFRLNGSFSRRRAALENYRRSEFWADLLSPWVLLLLIINGAVILGQQVIPLGNEIGPAATSQLERAGRGRDRPAAGHRTSSRVPGPDVGAVLGRSLAAARRGFWPALILLLPATLAIAVLGFRPSYQKRLRAYRAGIESRHLAYLNRDMRTRHRMVERHGNRAAADR